MWRRSGGGRDSVSACRSDAAHAAANVSLVLSDAAEMLFFIFYSFFFFALFRQRRRLRGGGGVSLGVALGVPPRLANFSAAAFSLRFASPPSPQPPDFTSLRFWAPPFPRTPPLPRRGRRRRGSVVCVCGGGGGFAKLRTPNSDQLTSEKPTKSPRDEGRKRGKKMMSVVLFPFAGCPGPTAAAPCCSAPSGSKSRRPPPDHHPKNSWGFPKNTPSSSPAPIVGILSEDVRIRKFTPHPQKKPTIKLPFGLLSFSSCASCVLSSRPPSSPLSLLH